MAEITCDICNQSITASAMCEHIRVRFEYVVFCLICCKPIDIEAVSFGYGSIYDGGSICMDCASKYIDPVVKAAIENQGSE